MDMITLDTHQKEELIDVTGKVRQIVAASGVADGLCHIFCRHTTAGLTINENADPDVKRDILMALSRMVSDDWPYKHGEGNSPAHLKSSIMGCQLSIPIRSGRLELGTWQGILFAEFDGPRHGRRIHITVIHSGG
ncbi:YjbQ family protein [bacterium]|nr:YjbQ family protein [bacterium]